MTAGIKLRYAGNIAVCLFLLFPGILKCQDFEWAYGIHIKSQDVKHVTDPDGNSFIIATQLGQLPYLPGEIAGIPAPEYKKGYWSYVAKFNSSGQFCWVKWLLNAITGDIASDKKGALFLSFTGANSLNSDTIILPGNSLYITNEPCHLAKLDTTGSVIWVKPTGIFAYELDFAGNYLYLGGYTGTLKFNGVTYPTHPNGLADSGMLFVVKTDTAMNVVHYTQFNGAYTSSYVNFFEVDDKGTFYVSAKFKDSVYIDGILHYFPVVQGREQIFYAKFSQTGAYEWIKIIQGKNCFVQDLEVDNNSNLYLAARLSYEDTSSTMAVDTGIFILSFNHHGDFRWKKDIRAWRYNSSGYSSASVTDIELINNFIYFTSEIESVLSGSPGNPGRVIITFGPTVIDTSLSFFAGTHTCISKLDTAGYYLYTFFGIKEVSHPIPLGISGGLGGDSLGNAYISGDFSKISFGPHTLKTLYDSGFWETQPEAYLTKIKDISISRGAIHQGPYCSGDSILIPFIIKGNFAADNTFIAELSDTNGKFDNPIVLGKLQGNLNGSQTGIITGYIPRYNFIGSDKYRVRIFATNPVVSSFYIDDPLRIRVYSSDTANAGGDTSVCYGNPVTLTTYGGTRVVWSAFPHKDSAVTRVYKALPDSATEYRVIISDTSGCGVTDTDYVKITLPKPLLITLPDTVQACHGDSVLLNAVPAGGDSAKHQVRWYDSAGQLLNTGKSFKMPFFSSRTYKTILTDGCARSDTAWVTIIPDKKIKLTASPDTTICLGQSCNLSCGLNICNNSYIKYKWDNNLGNGNIKTVSPQKTTTYTVVVTDTLGTGIDTVQVTVIVRPRLNISINNDTTICSGKNLNFTASISGGLSSSYAITWTGSVSGFVSDKINFNYTPSIPQKYFAQLTDGCSTPAMDSVWVTVVPNPVAAFASSVSEGCPPLLANFTNTSANHDSNFNTWVVNNQKFPTASENFAFTFNNPGKYSVGINVSNLFGCADSIYKNQFITVFNKPTSSFILKPDIIETESPLLLYNYSQRANNYTWDFGDGNTLYQTNQNDTIYNYKDSGNYAIRLIAENDKGCKDTASRKIRVFDKINCIIPNAFTPNSGDDLNPVFAPVCAGVAQYTLTIYNRWGQVVHTCENCAWDGTYYGTPVIAGVYMYKLHLHAESSKKSLVFGMVNVVR